jgi:hypothetical protein
MELTKLLMAADNFHEIAYYHPDTMMGLKLLTCHHTVPPIYIEMGRYILRKF